MQAHWFDIVCGTAMAWGARAGRAALVAVSGQGAVVAATVTVPVTAIAKTKPRGKPGGLVTRRMA